MSYLVNFSFHEKVPTNEYGGPLNFRFGIDFTLKSYSLFSNVVLLNCFTTLMFWFTGQILIMVIELPH